ncbi:hypothetical protein B0H11DRAFT_1966706 [Mycena galericulata]|nr:hypothetical protein B0H11DRAFT_1966706 [Mycena galericulata]
MRRSFAAGEGVFGSGARSASDAAERPCTPSFFVGAGVEVESAVTAGVVGGAVYGGAAAMRSRRRIAIAGGACRCVSRGRNTPAPPFAVTFAVAPSSASAGSSALTRASCSRVRCATRKASSAGMSTADLSVGEQEEDPPGVGVLGVSGWSAEAG